MTNPFAPGPHNPGSQNPGSQNPGTPGPQHGHGSRQDHMMPTGGVFGRPAQPPGTPPVGGFGAPPVGGFGAPPAAGFGAAPPYGPPSSGPPPFGAPPTEAPAAFAFAPAPVAVKRPVTVIVASVLLWLSAAGVAAQLWRILGVIGELDESGGVSTDSTEAVTGFASDFVVGRAAPVASALVWLFSLIAIALYLAVGTALWRGATWPRVVALILAVLSLPFLLGLEPLSTAIVLAGIVATGLAWMADSISFAASRR